MEISIGIEQTGKNSYPVKTIEYIRGILHTYAQLNQPDANLVFEYELAALGKSKSLQEDLKEQFFIFERQQIELNEISKDSFADLLKHWFYHYGDIRDMDISERKKENGIRYFIALLEDILKTEQIFRIENLKDEYEQVHLELGISYDYFLLHSPEQTHILYFTYRD